MNATKLKVKLIESGMSIADLGDKINCPKSTLYTKVSGKTEFTYSELVAIKDALNLTSDEFTDIFGL